MALRVDKLGIKIGYGQKPLKDQAEELGYTLFQHETIQEMADSIVRLFVFNLISKRCFLKLCKKLFKVMVFVKNDVG